VVVIGGLVFLGRALTKGSSSQLALIFAGLLGAGLLAATFLFGVRTQISTPIMHGEHTHVLPDEHGQPSHGVLPSRNEVAHAEAARGEVAHDHEPSQPSDKVKEPDPKAAAGATNVASTSAKPAWLIQGTQTGNGVSQFPVSSELFATVAECQKDLDRRIPALIAEEARYLRGEPEAVPLLPGEAPQFVADQFTEEVTTSQGTWYRVHRLVKIDERLWSLLQQRFEQAHMLAKLQTLGLLFGGVMLVLGIAYLLLRRRRREVDPTLNTFSTT
jgi:hypothetical protein